MHGLYKRFLLFCAVFVALIFAVVGFWLLLGVTCSCAVLVLADMPERLSGRWYTAIRRSCSACCGIPCGFPVSISAPPSNAPCLQP